MTDQTQPSGAAKAVTTSDTVPLSPMNATSIEWPRAIYIGGYGNLTVKFPGGIGPVTFSGVVAGTWLPIRPEYVMATNTTATSIVAVY